MRFRTILTLATLFSCFVVAVWSRPLTREPADRSYEHLATHKGSVSGRISSIGDASFSVEVKKSQDFVTLRFFIDDSTRIEGRLEIGSVATVDYRSDDGNNIATRIVVQSAANSQ
jgi:hypothetical protein